MFVPVFKRKPTTLQRLQGAKKVHEQVRWVETEQSNEKLRRKVVHESRLTKAC